MADLKTKIIRRLILQIWESLQVQRGNNASEQSLSMGVCRGTLLLQSPRLARRRCRHSQPAHGQVHAHGLLQVIKFVSRDAKAEMSHRCDYH